MAAITNSVQTVVRVSETSITNSASRSKGYSNLPLDVFIKIFSHMRIPQALISARVCTTWHNMMQDDAFLKVRLFQELGVQDVSNLELLKILDQRCSTVHPPSISLNNPSHAQEVNAGWVFVEEPDAVDNDLDVLNFGAEE